MSTKPLPTEQILSMLAGAPPRIAVLTTDLTPAQLHAPPSPGEWSVNEVLAHLRACADVWGDCMATIITEDAPAYRAVSPRTYIKETDYPEQQFERSFPSFKAQRAELLTILESLTPAEWLRKATVTMPGRMLERTVHHYAERLARHERGHLRQIERIAKALSS